MKEIYGLTAKQEKKMEKADRRAKKDKKADRRAKSNNFFDQYMS